MSEGDRFLDPARVPAGRLARLARMGGLAGGIAGRAAVAGARALASGKRPDAAALLLTPANVAKFTGELARLRGAAMKMGQLMSMDGGALLPPELSEAMARLRAEARPMPPAQLKKQLDAEWGPGWLGRKVARFDVRPLAAASIGQVHRATLPDGRLLAVKVQYPGVRASIDSDVANMVTLARLSGLLPGIDLAPLAAEARRQLHDEADYAREAASLAHFGALLAGQPAFEVPVVEPGLSTASVLAMSFAAGQPIESLDNAPQADRDRVMRLLVDLVLAETFGFRRMQTDPNFANYRWNPDSGRLVLLDFGAVSEVPVAIARGYHRLMLAGLDGDRPAMLAAIFETGLLSEALPLDEQQRALALFADTMAPVAAGQAFDFKTSPLLPRLREEAMSFAATRPSLHLPPVETLALQRKFAGLFLLGNRLGARLDLRAALERWRVPEGELYRRG